MFERFTEEARQVVVVAGAESRRMRHTYTGTEHLLLGLLHVPGIARDALTEASVDMGAVRAQVEEIVGRGDEVQVGTAPMTPKARDVLEAALRESLSLGHDHLGPEHILAAILRGHEGVAIRILSRLANQDQLYLAVVSRMQASEPSESEASSESERENRLLAEHILAAEARCRHAAVGHGQEVIVREEAVERCQAHLSLWGAQFHCQRGAHEPGKYGDNRDRHEEHGDGWTMTW